MESTLRFQEKLTIIDQTPLFSSLSPDDKKFIASSSTLIEYKKGDCVYKEGSSPDAFYCMITGRARAYVARRGREEDLEVLKRGKYFGIISLLTGEPHSVTVQAINDSIILQIPKDGFNKVLDRIPKLAIHFSQTLSKRLKKVSSGEKTIFESTIISVYGVSDKIGTTNYIFSLGASLKAETNKKVMLLDMNEDSDLGIKPLLLDSPFFDEGLIKTSIFTHRLGMDVMNVPHRSGSVGHLISLLSYLTSDYHYVLVDLPGVMDNVVFELLKQSDFMHIITASDTASLEQAAKLAAELKGNDNSVAAKIKIITSEYGPGVPLEYAERKRILNHDIFATLPDMKRSPEGEYQRMIRRISRQIGDCLIGLALGSGASLGLAHVGVLKVLEDNGIPVDILAGTSMGALIGALWASGKTTTEIESMLSQFKKRIATFRLADLTWPKKGLIKGREVKRFLVSQFGKKTFYDLKLPFKIITCDIETREEVVLEEGSLADAVMASISIPGVFEPVKIGGRLLVDGGIINPLPTNVLMRSGVAKIIAVNTLPSPGNIQKMKKKDFNIFDVIVNSVQASEYLLAEASCQNADIAMHPILETVDWYEFYEEANVIQRGQDEALKYLPQLKELAVAR